ncbi:MAG: ISL3 family transposase [Bdellovibrionaceae bacterium]|jgi:transposase|nr:ISL3 family transposase [Pseudobdellovibrionaceae bacterium]
MMIPRIFRFANYETVDFKEYLSKNKIEIHLKRNMHARFLCGHCKHRIKPDKGCYKVEVQHLPLFNNHCYLVFRKYKGQCAQCKKTRSEHIDFISKETPHKTKDYSWWVGRLCEISPISNVAKVLDESASTTWRLDYSRMKRMLSNYRIPKPKRICVDEVYTRRKKEKGETRDDLFFTIICDLDTRKVIWVSYSRRKEALDEFFLIIGKKACEKITAVATDMHDGYGASVRQYCPQATLVWDRFHIMQQFDDAVNETRKQLHEEAQKGSEEQRLTRGKFRFMFLKKSSKRSSIEKQHIESVFEENKQFLRLELVKERMHSFFNARTAEEAYEIFDEIGGWVFQSDLVPLMRWHEFMSKKWHILKNYFVHRITSGLAEGMNHVIKTLKRKGYGYRNMHYFKLKILQTCGYLNSDFINDPYML